MPRENQEIFKLNTPGLESNRVEKALMAEKLVFNELAHKEEMMSIYDEISQYFTLETIMDSAHRDLLRSLPVDIQTKIVKLSEDALYSALPKTLKSAAQKLMETAGVSHFYQLSIDDKRNIRTQYKNWYKEHLSDQQARNAESSRLKTRIPSEIFEDIVALLPIENIKELFKDSTFKALFGNIISDSIYWQECKKLENEHGQLSRDSEDLAKLRATDISLKLESLFLYKYLPLRKLRQAVSADQQAALFAQKYAEHSRHRIENALTDLKLVAAGIQSGSANITENPDTKASRYAVDESVVNGHYQWRREGRSYSTRQGEMEDVEDITIPLAEKTQTEDQAQFHSRRQTLKNKRLAHATGLGAEAHADMIGNLVHSDFWAAYVYYKKELKYLYNRLHNGQIVETKAVKDIIDEAKHSLLKDPPTITFFHGDYGTGKTAIAIHIAKTVLKKNPIIVAGHKFLDPDRFTEEFRIQKEESSKYYTELIKKLGGENMPQNASLVNLIAGTADAKSNFREMVIQQRLRNKFNTVPSEPDQLSFAEWCRLNPLSEQEIKDVDDSLTAMYTNDVQGKYVLGALYQAMATGTPLIIDEANAITPEVLIAFNDLLTKKLGTDIGTRTAEGKIKVKPGYCVMWTGNTGQRYTQARHDIDPASYSRVHPIKVPYLPNNNALNSRDNLMQRLNLTTSLSPNYDSLSEMEEAVATSQKEAGEDQIFQVLLLKLMNDRLGARVLVKKSEIEQGAYSVIQDIYKLAMGARVIMDIFERKIDANFRLPGIEHFIGSDSRENICKTLVKSNLSMRELIDNIMGAYVNNGATMDLEYYIYLFVKKYAAYPAEQAILYAVLQQAGFFSSADGWKTLTEFIRPEATVDQNQRALADGLNNNPSNYVKKYKKIEQNGESLSFLRDKIDDNDAGYEWYYLSSLEMVQLLFGHLPALSSTDYTQVEKNISNLNEEQTQNTNFAELLEYLQQSQLGEKVRTVIQTFQSCNPKMSLDQKLGFIKECSTIKEKLDIKNFSTLGNIFDYIRAISEFCNVLIATLPEEFRTGIETVDLTSIGLEEDVHDLIDQTSDLINRTHQLLINSTKS